MYWDLIGTVLWIAGLACVVSALINAMRHAYEAEQDGSQEAVYGLPLDASLPADRPAWADPVVGLGAR